MQQVVPCVDPRSALDMESIFASDLPGFYNFKVLPFGDTKSSVCAFSTLLDKVFVNTGRECAIKFNIDNLLTPVYIRALLIYREADEAHNVPRRCRTHKSPEHQLNKECPSEQLHHLVRICDPSATYYVDMTNERTSVRVPISPSDSSEYSLMFKFTCLHACSGGLNRRDTKIVFLLEGEAGAIETYGRATLNLRMCACPGRDLHIGETRLKRIMEREMEQQIKREQKDMQTSEAPVGKKIKLEVKGEQTEQALGHNVILSTTDDNLKESFRKMLSAMDTVEMLKIKYPFIYQEIQDELRREGYTTET